MEGGSLKARLRPVGQPPVGLTVGQAARVGHDVAIALHDMHKEGFVHMDVALRNVLLDPSQQRAVLSDFGLTTRIGDRPPPVLPRVRDPLITDTLAVSPANDVFSLAVMLYHMVRVSCRCVGHARLINGWVCTCSGILTHH